MLGFGPIASAALADDVGVQEYELTLDAGSFALTFQDIDVDSSASFGAGGFTLTGQDIAFTHGIALDAGSFTVTGQTIDFGRPSKN